MKKALSLLIFTLAHAVDITLPSSNQEPNLPKPNHRHSYTFRPVPNTGSFNYLSVGASTHPTASNPLQSTLPSLTFGKRFLDGTLAWDYSLGARFSEYNQLVYIQSSYMLYPFQPNGLYLGLGLEGGVLRNSPDDLPSNFNLHYDMPLTIGYQFAGSEKRNFLQFQAYPRAYTSDDPTFSASYGFGF